MHFNFTDFPVNFIKQFVSCFFWCLKQMLLSKCVRYYCLHYIIPRILHIISRKSWYFMQTKSWWWAVPKICVYLILRILLKSRKFDAKYTRFTVLLTWQVFCSRNGFLKLQKMNTGSVLKPMVQPKSAFRDWANLSTNFWVHTKT